MNTTLYILGSVFVISLVSFAGIFTLSLRDRWLRRIIPFLIPLAIGAFFGDAFFHLIPESFEESGGSTMVPFLLLAGILSFFILEKLLRWHHHDPWEGDRNGNTSPSDDKHLGNLVLISDGFHNFIDGIIVGASYLVSIEIGIATTLAIILHEIPQEMGDFGILLYAGYKKNTALLYNFLSALAAVGGAILLLLLGSSFTENFIPSIIPFTAGVFIYIASSDLIPELHKAGGAKNLLRDIIGISIGVLAMYLLLFLE